MWSIRPPAELSPPEGFRRAPTSRTWRAERGLHNVRLVVPFYHSFSFPFDEEAGIPSARDYLDGGRRWRGVSSR